MTGTADVVVATAELDDDTRRCVAAACDRLSARYVPWEDGELRLERPSLLVAGLPAGQRRVPPHLMRLCTETHPGTPLLLLCQEGLVSPTVSLHGGQIVLVGPPFSVARIHGRLAVLQAELTSDDAQSVVTALDPPGQQVWTRERLHDDVWVASIGCRGHRRGSPPTPLLATHPDGVTALLPMTAGDALADEVRDAILDELRAPVVTAERLRRARAAGPDVGIIHYDRRSEEWLTTWPQPSQPLWLYSAQRLPSMCELGATMRRGGGRALGAAGGDVVLGLVGQEQRADGDTAGFAALLRRGGPSVLAALERHWVTSPWPLAAVLLEVRA